MSTRISELSKGIRERMGWSQQQLADHLLISRNYVSLVEGGHKDGSVRLLTALERLRVDVEAGRVSKTGDVRPHIVGEDPAPYRTDPLPKPNGRIVPPPPNLRLIPVLSWAHAGEAGNYEQIADHEQEQIFYDGNDRRAFAVIVEGDCMAPKFVPGDRVIIAPTRDPLNGNSVVTKLANDGSLLRLFHRVDPKTIRLISMNPALYPDTVLKAGQYHWCWPVQYSISRHL